MRSIKASAKAPRWRNTLQSLLEMVLDTRPVQKVSNLTGSWQDMRNEANINFLLGTDTNGDGAHDLNGATDKAAMPETEDTEMEHTDAAVTIAASSSTPAKPSNGTPASSKKSGSASTKKRSSAVPEHKTKKLNKRKSKSALVTQLDAQPGDYYFARMKGHPPWPSIVCDEEMLPQSLLDSRPITTKQPDGTFKKEDYADGGKRAQERTFPIMFL